MTNFKQVKHYHLWITIEKHTHIYGQIYRTNYQYLQREEYNFGFKTP